MVSIRVSSTIDSSIFLQKALALGEKLGLPTTPCLEQCEPGLILAITPDGLQLLELRYPGKRPITLLAIDFVRGKNGYRLCNERTIKQPLARAVGIKPGYRPRVLDATGGLGGDALVLAGLGCQVTMCERSPILSVLLEDALSRASQSSSPAASAAGRIRLLPVDARHHLAEFPQAYASVYLDPMYPSKEQSALNRQTMRTIRMLVGDDQDGGQLLALARKYATERVAVKRPRSAPHLGDAAPAHSIMMKNSRFDVYLGAHGQAPSICDTSPLL